MTVRIKISGKEYAVKESIRNVKRTYKIQQMFLKLGSKVNIDGENATPKQIEEAISANVDSFDDIMNYIADVINDKRLTVDFMEDNLTTEELTQVMTELINGILHIEEKDEEVKQVKKLASAKRSKA
ncbi:phage tail assembly chaperone G [Sporolactobacillus putidus]|uniref:Uncharacterized protein n=1 Tax=Sporolactobacillus putidus TaxID=492735 RepID=A0A917S5G3_9BACL|nr:phage tail tube assembly chaperone [Sporolactobacillus putidus]GGL55916.1 hypothetical protein GCM10007968_20040 [Sporolactobacillus putidus]